MKISILHEDNHLLVVEKPVNIPVQEDRTQDRDLLSILKDDLKNRFEKPGNVFLGLVHRLDRPVGGAMVFAKTSKAASRMSDLIRRQAMDRTYIAVVRGRPPKKIGRAEHYLMKDTRKNIVSIVQPSHKLAKIAVLDYEIMESKDGLSLLSVRLHTGRPHQIRVQLAALGCPLYGDQKYGRKLNEHGQQIALWARTLQFIHPVKKEAIEVHSSPPHHYPWSLWTTLT